MAVFEIEQGGKRFQVEAPDMQSAMEALEGMSLSPAPSGKGDRLPLASGAVMHDHPMQPAKAERGSIIDPIFQGILPGFADEAGGVVGGVVSAIKGEGFSKGYDEFVDLARGNLEAYRERQPLAAAAGEIGGTLATLPVAAGLNVFRAPAVVSRTAPLATKAANAAQRTAATLGNAAVGGAGWGGLYGLGSGDGDLGDRLESAWEGAKTGAMFGPAVVGGAGAIRSLGKGLGRITGLTGALGARNEASRRVVEAAQRDMRGQGGSLDDAAQMLDDAQGQGIPMTALDVGEATRGLGRAAADTSPEGRAILNQTVNDRFVTQADRIIDTISRSAPGVNSPATRDMLQQAARRTNRPAYDRAMLDGEAGIWHRGLEQLTVADDMKAAIRGATKTGTNKAAVEGGRPPKNPFTINPDGSLTLQPGTKPTLRFWDHVKRNLDDRYEVLKRAGEKDAASDVLALKKHLVEYLDQAVPSYRNARQGAAAFFGADDALTAGQNFVRMSGDVTKNAEARKAIAAMTPAERSLFGEGFATQIIEDIRRVPDRLSVIKRIFQSPAARERFEIALGPQASREMEATLRIETILDLGREAVTGNSKTARYLTELIGGAGAGVGYTALTGSLDPKTLLVSALGGFAVHGLRRGSAAVDQRVMREIADMLASNDPQVFREAVARIARNPNYMSALRRGNDRLVRLMLPNSDNVQFPNTGTQPAIAEDQQ